MRQRLRLAAAMLGDPDVLVLDEPTNGLDPPGMKWLREHLRSLADQGRTVLVSSHALGEVEQIADHVLVLNHGHLLRSAGLTELRTEAGAGSRIRTPEPDRLIAALRAAGHHCTQVDDDLVADAAPEEVGELAARHGLVLHRLMPTIDLEHVFLRLISESDQARRSAATTRTPS
jgi:ABC-2 type transport system ATP-binding protein